jgi:hypothetical protein
MPRKTWSKKDERQYRHVKDSELDRGRSAIRRFTWCGQADPSTRDVNSVPVMSAAPRVI